MIKSANQITHPLVQMHNDSTLPDGIQVMSAMPLVFHTEKTGDNELPLTIPILPAGKILKGADGRVVRNSNPSALVSAYNKSTIQIMVDVSHKSVGGFIDPPAQGWITSMTLEGGAIFGAVEWTDLGEDVLRKKHYRYISPAYIETPDGEIGKFISVGLVNQPNLEMAAVARATPGTPKTFNKEKESIVDEEQLAALRKAYGLADDASVEDVIAATIAAAPKIVDEDNSSNNEEGAAAENAGAADAGSAAAAGEDGGQSPIAENAPDLADYVPRSDYDAVRDKLAEFEAGEEEAPSDAEITEAVDGAIKAARVAPSSRSHYVTMCGTKKGLASFKEFTASGPKIVTAKSEAGKGVDTTSLQHLSPAEIEVCTATGISQKSFLAQKQKEKTHA